MTKKILAGAVAAVLSISLAFSAKLAPFRYQLANGTIIDKTMYDEMCNGSGGCVCAYKYDIADPDYPVLVETKYHGADKKN